MNTKTETRVFQQREGEAVPNSRLLLMRLRLFMGLKSWAAFNKAIDGPRAVQNFYPYVRRDPTRRKVPAGKYLLKMLDVALKTATQREEQYKAQIAALQARLNNQDIPCERCPMAGYTLPASMTAQRDQSVIHG